MAASKQSSVSIGMAAFRWSVLRLPTWARDAKQRHKLLGVAILVESMETGRRKLVLQLEIDPTRHGDMSHHQRFRVPEGRLIEAIESAMAASWDPDSRARRFVHGAGPLQPR